MIETLKNLPVEWRRWKLLHASASIEEEVEEEPIEEEGREEERR